MFKDYDKYLSASLKVYIFVLIIVFILKIVGLDYFGINVSNEHIIKISNTLSSTHWGDVIFFLSVYIQFYFYLCLVCKKRKLYKEAIIGTILNYSFQMIVSRFVKVDWIYYIYSFLLMIIIPMVINKNLSVKRQIKYIFIISFYQLICLTIRNVGVNNNYGNFLIDTILNIDQLLLLAITYNLFFMKGGSLVCGGKQVVGYSLQMKKNFSNLQKKWQENSSNFKKLNKEEKATIIIYSVLSFIWNIFTIITIIVIAKLNDTIIECIFILSSFWLSKKVFGKAFHLKSMLQCFIVSNISYYILNRITTPIGISILIPIMLGVALSYITSKFVKKAYQPLYKGMPEEEFNKSILQVVEKGSSKYNICYDFFIEKENAIILGRKHGYTESGIRKITSRVNDSIKALNK